MNVDPIMDKPGQKLLRGGGYAAHGNQPKQAVAVAGAVAAGLVGLRVIGALCARIGGRQGQRQTRREEQERQRREGRRCRIIVDSTSPPAALHAPLSTSSSASTTGVIHVHANCRGTPAAASGIESPSRVRFRPGYVDQQDEALPASPLRLQGADKRSEQRIEALEAQLREARQERSRVGAEVARAREAVAATESQLAAAMRQLSGLQSRITALTSEKKATEQACKDAKSQLAAANRQASLARAVQSAAENLQVQLQEAQQGRAAAEAQLRSLLAQQHKQQQGAASVQKVRAEAELTREEMGEMRRALHNLQEELESARSARARSDAALAAAQHQLRRLEAEKKLHRETTAGRARKRGS
ncbi:hypothetical protein ABPG75_011966 [Micractinium tetrahymenae]